MYVECYDEVGAQVYDTLLRHALQDLKLARAISAVKLFIDPRDALFIGVVKLEKASQALLGNIISALNEPKNKVKAKEQIKEQARVSIQAKLKEKQKQVMEYEKKQDVHIRKKNMEL